MIEGKHAVVTGGGRGIGLAVVRALHEAGARVSAIGRSAPEADSPAFWARGDVCDEASVEAAFEQCRAKYGPVAILVNNSGIAESAPLQRTDRAMWERIIATNLTGTYLCTHAVVSEMREAGFGRVVNIASIAGLYGAPYIAAYCASKHGVVGFTRALAAEWAGTGLTANAVCPGYTETAMMTQAIENIVRKTGVSKDAAREQLAQSNPGGRIVSAEEVAHAVLALCAGEENGREVVLPLLQGYPDVARGPGSVSC